MPENKTLLLEELHRNYVLEYYCIESDVQEIDVLVYEAAKEIIKKLDYVWVTRRNIIQEEEE